MFRLSRINSPRASFAAIALLAIVLITFGAIAQMSLPDAAVFASSETTMASNSLPHSRLPQ